MRRLASLGSRTFRRQFGRYLLTAAGIALGVAVYFGITVANASVTATMSGNFGLDSTSETVFVQAAGAYGGDVPADALEAVARLPGVASASGWVSFPLPVTAEGQQEPEAMYVSGVVERRGTAKRRESPPQDEAPPLEGREANADGEAVVGGGAVRRLNARIGGRISVTTPTGPHELTVTGVHRPPDAPTGGGWAEVTIETARRLAGKGDVFTSLPVRLGEGVDAGDWIADHGDKLGPAVRVSRAGEGGEEFRELVRLMQSTFSGLALVAMSVGAFLVFLTLSTAVVERTRLYGTLRALGASRRQVLGTVLREATALAVVSSLTGIALGLGAAQLFVRFASDVTGVTNPRIVVSPSAIVGGMAVGLLVTLAAALIPAVRAARLSPVDAIRGGVADERRLSRAWMAGVVIFVAGGLLGIAPATPLVQVSGVFILVGTVLLVPLVTGPVARVVGPLTRRLAPSVGDVSVMHLVKERSRSAYTLALVMVVLSTLLAIGGIQLSFRRATDRTIDHRFPADLAVSAGQRIDPAFEDQVRRVPGVRDLTAIRWGRAAVVGPGAAPVEVVILDPKTFFRVQGIPWVDGSDAASRDALVQGGGVLVPEGLSRRFGAGRGESIMLDTTEGVRRFVVAGVYPTTDSQKRVMIGLPDATRYFNAGDPNFLAVKVDRDAKVTTVAERIENTLRDRNVFVVPTNVRKDEVRRGGDQYFNMLYAVLGVAAVMGLLGLANTLAMAVIQRTREIGVLRAIGTHRRQVRSLIVVEAATLVGVALVLAIPLGWLLSISLLQNSTEVLGVVVPYQQPWVMVPVVTLTATVVAVLAAIAPARRAARVQPTVALRFD